MILIGVVQLRMLHQNRGVMITFPTGHGLIMKFISRDQVRIVQVEEDGGSQTSQTLDIKPGEGGEFDIRNVITACRVQQDRTKPTLVYAVRAFGDALA